MSARGSDLLALGFGTAVAQWAIGYVCRLPAVPAPAWLVFVLLLLCLVAGGWAAARWTGRGWPFGLAVGVVTGAIDLLVLGSFLAEGRAALLWIPGALAVSALLCAAGAALGAGAPRPAGWDWTAAFAWVAVAATLLLLAVGGLVTSHDAGLAVVDWPNTFGSSMFLYPLSRMTGGIYYEHAHRLFGSLVGLTTVVLAIQVWRVERRRWVRRLALAAVPLVIVQGILGGLRVTGRFTLSSSPDDTAPQVGLAVVHGVLAQLFLGVLVALAIGLTWRWRRSAPRPAQESDRTLGIAALALLLVQIALGALQRHLAWGVMVHLTLAAIVAPLVVVLGMRAWGRNPDDRWLGRHGLWLAAITGLQVLLGLGAFIATGAMSAGMRSQTWDVTLATAHQWTGAVMLALTVSVVMWAGRRQGTGVDSARLREDVA